VSTVVVVGYERCRTLRLGLPLALGFTLRIQGVRIAGGESAAARRRCQAAAPLWYPAGVRPAGVVFDLDGTLVDSRRDLATAVNATRQRLALRPLQLEEVVAMVGEGARVLLRRALPATVTEEDFETALGLFLDLYLECCVDTTQPYPGIADLLRALAPRYPLFVLTNKPGRHSRRILDGLGLGEFFVAVIGGDTLPARKPDPAGLHAIAGRLGTTAPRLLLVGDSGIDANTAAAAGTPLALVAWGYGRPAELADVPAWRLAEPRELLAGLA
jgi:phosphoglycolate phosphatase